MPVIQVYIIEGYDQQARQRLGEVLTDASRLVIPAPADAVTVMINELSPANYCRGRTTRQPAAALPDASNVVRAFLNELQSRNLPEASRHVSDNFTMRFPGGVVMHRLDELEAWAAGRYRKIGKLYEGFDVCHDGVEASVVYCRGTLHGVWPDGETFSGIRFIDRFELVNGLITDQAVWNDLAEHRLQALQMKTE